METSAAKPAREKLVPPAAISAPERPVPHVATRLASSPLQIKAIGYGLPCAQCHAYYPSDMNACPICKSPDRVLPSTPVAHCMVAPEPPAPVIGAQIDDDRERFLKELKSQAFASHTQISAATTFRCVLEHQHTGATEPAAVCHSCYSEARQHADRLEAAFHMDVREAAKIVHEAVWADTSDPNGTYLNAARALLSELQKRAGIGLVLGPNQPLTH